MVFVEDLVLLLVWHVTDAVILFSQFANLSLCVVAIPICVKLMQTYLMDFVHRISFPWWVLLAGAIFTLLIAFVSVIGCTLRTAMSNPIDSIKAE